MSTEKISEELVDNLPFRDPSLSVEDRVKNLLKRLTLKEKFRLLPGYRVWKTRKIKRLGIPSFRTTDGPIGVAWHSSFKKNTRFPTSILVSSTWNRVLASKLGVAMGEETRATGRHCILAPGINVHRTPLCGRTFEYFSEDPYLIKELAIPLVKGIQKNKVAACVKHYVANNQEHKRFKVNAIIDERTLNEIYLKPFADTVRESDPWTIMACYNRVNGLFGCEHEEINRKYLMEQFGFQGLIMSDWFATRNIQSTEACVKAGLSLEMPYHLRYKKKNLKKAYKEGKITDEDVDFLIERTLRVMVKVGLFDEPNSLQNCERNNEQHQKLTKEIAGEGMVLLKNENNILPLDPATTKTIAIVGPNSDKKMGKPLYGGSSAVWPPYQVTPKKGLKNYCKKHDIKITKKLEKADAVIFVGGLDHSFQQDAEGVDKLSLNIPNKQVKQIHDVLQLNPMTIMILISGSPISMSEFFGTVPVILEAWYPGMEGGNAIVELLFGEVNPSGKLPITFPKHLCDSPAHKSFETYPGNDDVKYEEGIFVGYKHNDKEGIEPLFPFGFGLSYTSFEYSDLNLEKSEITKEDQEIKLNFNIKNIGDRAGKEIAQVYLSNLECSVERPVKELKGFSKVELKPNEKKLVEISIKTSDIGYYDIKTHNWVIEPGKFKILVGSSSKDIYLEKEFIYN